MAPRKRAGREKKTGVRCGPLGAGAPDGRPVGRRATGGGLRGANAGAEISFEAVLCTPRAEPGRRVSWAFLVLPHGASAQLPSRGQVAVAGAVSGRRFRTTLEPDGRGGHWMKVGRALRLGAGVAAGDVVHVQMTARTSEPEPRVPGDLRRALGAAGARVRAAWADITPAARRDFVHWITSPKREETRAKRVEATCDMLAKGKRRPCCFDRSGMYSASLSCPEAEGASG